MDTSQVLVGLQSIADKLKRRPRRRLFMPSDLLAEELGMSSLFSTPANGYGSFGKILKSGNPYHDENGQFTSKDKAHSALSDGEKTTALAKLKSLPSTADRDDGAAILKPSQLGFDSHEAKSITWPKAVKNGPQWEEELEIPANKFVNGQGWVRVDGLEKHIHGAAALGEKEGDLPVVVRINDEDRYYVSSGHHRIGAQMLAGRGSVKVKVLYQQLEKVKTKTMRGWDWKVSQLKIPAVRKYDYARILKANPYRTADGRFTDKAHAAFPGTRHIDKAKARVVNEMPSMRGMRRNDGAIPRSGNEKSRAIRSSGATRQLIGQHTHQFFSTDRAAEATRRIRDIYAAKVPASSGRVSVTREGSRVRVATMTPEASRIPQLTQPVLVGGKRFSSEATAAYPRLGDMTTAAARTRAWLSSRSSVVNRSATVQPNGNLVVEHAHSFYSTAVAQQMVGRVQRHYQNLQLPVQVMQLGSRVHVRGEFTPATAEQQRMNPEATARRAAQSAAPQQSVVTPSTRRRSVIPMTPVLPPGYIVDPTNPRKMIEEQSGVVKPIPGSLNRRQWPDAWVQDPVSGRMMNARLGISRSVSDADRLPEGWMFSNSHSGRMTHPQLLPARLPVSMPQPTTHVPTGYRMHPDRPGVMIKDTTGKMKHVFTGRPKGFVQDGAVEETNSSQVRPQARTESLEPGKVTHYDRLPVGHITPANVEKLVDHGRKVTVSDSGGTANKAVHDATGLTPQQFTRKLLSGIPTENIQNLEVSYKKTRRGFDMNLRGHVMVDGKRSSITLDRYFYNDDKTVYHAYFGMGIEGGGYSRMLFGPLGDIYDHMGVKRVDVHAALGVGGYSWARYGFKPTLSDWETLKYMMKNHGLRNITNPKMRANVQKMLESDDPAMIQAIAAIKAKADDGKSIGKKLLAGNDWHGSLDMEDPKRYSIFRSYLNERRA